MVKMIHTKLSTAREIEAHASPPYSPRHSLYGQTATTECHEREVGVFVLDMLSRPPLDEQARPTIRLCSTTLNRGRDRVRLLNSKSLPLRKFTKIRKISRPFSNINNVTWLANFVINNSCKYLHMYLYTGAYFWHIGWGENRNWKININKK